MTSNSTHPKTTTGPLSYTILVSAASRSAGTKITGRYDLLRCRKVVQKQSAATTPSETALRSSAGLRPAKPDAAVASFLLLVGARPEAQLSASRPEEEVLAAISSEERACVGLTDSRRGRTRLAVRGIAVVCVFQETAQSLCRGQRTVTTDSRSAQPPGTL